MSAFRCVHFQDPTLCPGGVVLKSVLYDFGVCFGAENMHLGVIYECIIFKTMKIYKATLDSE